MQLVHLARVWEAVHDVPILNRHYIISALIYSNTKGQFRHAFTTTLWIIARGLEHNTESVSGSSKQVNECYHGQRIILCQLYQHSAVGVPIHAYMNFDVLLCFTSCV